MGTHPINVTDASVSPELAFGKRVEWILPQELKTSPLYDVRAYTGPGEDRASADEDKKIELLSVSLEENQQEDLIVLCERRGGVDTYTIVTGHRRRRAALLANERRSQLGRPLLRLRCHVFMPTEIDARKVALTNNIQRRDLTPLQKAKVFGELRVEKGWDGPSGTVKLAKYLGVSTALIIQCEKFLSPQCTAEIREGLATGELSAESAHLLMKEAVESRGRLIKRSREVQVEAAAEKVVEDLEKGGRKAREAEQGGGEVRIKQAQEGRIEAPAVRKAIREEHEKQAGGGGSAGSAAKSEPEPVGEFPPTNGIHESETFVPDVDHSLSREGYQGTPPPAHSTIGMDTRPKPAQSTPSTNPIPNPAWSRKELLEFFDQFDSDAYGYESGAVRRFVTYLRQLAAGKGQEKQARKLWDQMVEKAPKGVKPKTPKPVPVVKPKPPTAKSKSKPKSKANSSKPVADKAKPKPKAAAKTKPA